jgi:hypothetical protein
MKAGQKVGQLAEMKAGQKVEEILEKGGLKG